MNLKQLAQNEAEKYAPAVQAIQQRQNKIDTLNERVKRYSKEAERIQQEIESMRSEIAMLIRVGRNEERELRQNLRPDMILARALSNATGLACEVIGPIGLHCEGVINLYRENEEGAPLHTRPCISLHYRNGDSLEKMTYRKGCASEMHRSGRIGTPDGMNEVYAPMPMELREIVDLMVGDKGLLLLAKKKISESNC